MDHLTPPLRVLVLLDNPFTHDQRVRREASSLAAAGHDVTLLATPGPGLPDGETIDGVRVRREVEPDVMRARDRGAVARLAERLAGEGSDVAHCHDHWMLRVGAALKRRRPQLTLIYDSHELFHAWPLNLDHHTPGWLRLKSRLARRYSILQERRHGCMADHVVTVNDSLADDLHRHFRRPTRPLVVRNTPRLVPQPPRGRRLRDRFAIPDSQHILVFIGSRLHTGTLNLERVLDEFRERRGAALVFISGRPLAGNEVAAYARHTGCRNAHFHEAVPPDEVIPTLASADFGLVPTWNRRDLSYWYALDNKLFDYVAAGLPVLATAQPEYRRIVDGYRLGVCVNPDEPLAYSRGFDALLAGEARFREQAGRAREELTWEKEEAGLLALYAQLRARRSG